MANDELRKTIVLDTKQAESSIKSLNSTWDRLVVDINTSKDKIKELNKGIKELKGTGAGKDLVIIKAQEEQKLKAMNAELKKTEKQLKQTGEQGKTSMMNLYAGYQLAKEGATILYSIGKKLIGLSNTQEDAERGLTFMLGNRAQKYKDLAKQMQLQYNVGDEVIMQNMQLALSMGVQEKNLEKVTRGGIALSKALGGRVGMNMATRMLTNAIEEQDFTLLNTYIPAMKSAGTNIEKNIILNDLLTKSMGFAEDQTKTFAGQTEALSLAIGDMGEKIGDEIKKTIGSPGGVGIIGLFSEFFVYSLAKLRHIGINWGIFALNIVESMKWVADSITISAKAGFDAWNTAFGGLGKGLSDFMESGDFRDIGKGLGEGIFNGVNDGIEKIKTIEAPTLKGFEEWVDPNKVKEKTKAIDEQAESIKKVVTELKAYSDTFRELNADEIGRLKQVVQAVEEIGNEYEKLPEVQLKVQESYMETTDFMLSQALVVGSIMSELNNREMQEINDKYN